MQILHIPPNLFPFPAKPLPKPCHPSKSLSLTTISPSKLSVKAVPEDNIPVYTDAFLEQYSLQGGEYEDEYRRRNWIESGWAPWEEILSPEGVFARTSLNEGEEVALQTPEAIEAFRMLRPSYRKKKMEEMGLTEDDYYRNQFKIKGEIPEKLETIWAGPLVVRQVAPRDWPPRGWEVDKEELEFIRGSHRMMQEGMRLGEEELKESNVRKDTDEMCLERYKVFLKQYKEWVAANKDRLEEESYKFDQDYHPGRRKRGKDYKEGMYELPFYYPGQICLGKVTTLHLYQGAFVDIGGVYDGWVPIKNNDWYWIRHHIKVGMDVVVEILAKRDPFRFRFPIEMRFVDPNIDHLIFNRFEFPPIIQRDGDINPDEIQRDCGRPPIPRKDPGVKVEEEPLLSNHPYVDQIWQLHVAEQMILDDMQINPDKYKGKKLSELTDDEEINHENSVEHTKVQYKKSSLRKTIRRTSVKELDLEAAYAERQHHNKLAAEARERGEKYKISKLRRNIEMDEYDLLHWRRSFEEREALLRDISCRRSLGLPVVEPGRYDDKNYIGKDDYDPLSPLHQYDYWGEPKNSKKSRKERMEVYHNMSVVGKSPVWYEMSYEDAVKQQMKKEARLEEEAAKAKELDDKEDLGTGDKEDENEDSDADDDFMYDLLSKVGMDDVDDQPVVNGTQSSGIPDDDFFDD